MRLSWVLLVAGCNYDGVPKGTLDASSDASSDAPKDATPDDGWTAASCPPGYVAVPGQTSRYRVDEMPLAAWVHSDRCVASDAGMHLAAIDDIAELFALKALIDSHPGLPTAAGFTDVFVWSGGVQMYGLSSVSAGWLKVTGGELLMAWESGEPNDYGGTLNLEDNEENFAMLWKGHAHLADAVGRLALPAICECDGKTMDAAAIAAINASRPL